MQIFEIGLNKIAIYKIAKYELVKNRVIVNSKLKLLVRECFEPTKRIQFELDYSKNNYFKIFSLTSTPVWEMANITNEENCSAPTDHGDFFSRTFENRHHFWALIFAIAE